MLRIMWLATSIKNIIVKADRVDRHVLKPRPADNGPHHRPGIGDAAFLPLCIAAGCSPEINWKFQYVLYTR